MNTHSARPTFEVALVEKINSRLRLAHFVASTFGHGKAAGTTTFYEHILAPFLEQLLLPAAQITPEPFDAKRPSFH